MSCDLEKVDIALKILIEKYPFLSQNKPLSNSARNELWIELDGLMNEGLGKSESFAVISKITLNRKRLEETIKPGEFLYDLSGKPIAPIGDNCIKFASKHLAAMKSKLINKEAEKMLMAAKTKRKEIAQLTSELDKKRKELLLELKKEAKKAIKPKPKKTPPGPWYARFIEQKKAERKPLSWDGESWG